MAYCRAVSGTVMPFFTFSNISDLVSNGTRLSIFLLFTGIYILPFLRIWSYYTGYTLAEYQKNQPLSDNQIVEASQNNHRIIYQYKAKRAALDIRNIEKQVIKAQRIASGQSSMKKNRFLTLQTGGKRLNQKLIDKAYALAGIKGYVTNLDTPPLKVISAYHQLFEVEASFRMAKSDLKARPIFHHKREAIEAHLTVVFASLAVSRRIEWLTGISIKRFIRNLRPIRSGTVTLNGKEYTAEAEVPKDIHRLIQKLQSGH